MKPNESISDAVQRTLETKTGIFRFKLSTYKNYQLKQTQLVTLVDMSISVPILVLLIEPTNVDTNWSNFEPDLELDFDHTKMVNKAFNILANNWDKHPLPLLLTGNSTTLEETRDLLAHFQPY